MTVRARIKAMLCMGAAVAAFSVALPAAAQSSDEVQALRAQVKELMARIEKLEKAPPPAAAPAASAAATAAPPAAALAGPTVKVPAPLPGQKEQELVTSGSFPGSWRLPGTDLSMRLYGFAKLDFIYDFRDVGAEDVFVASSLPRDAGNRNGRTRIHARESRIGVETRASTPFGPLKAVVEGDFFGAAAGAGTSDQLQFNSYAFRTRLAYGELGPVMAGQNWTTFGDTSAFIETADFFAESGRVAMRVPMIRYTSKIDDKTVVAFAVENPENDIFLGNATGTGLTQTDGLPDFVTHVRHTASFGHVQVGGVLRSLSVDNVRVGTRTLSDDKLGYAVNMSGKINVGATGAKDNLKFQASFGEGLGRYNNDLSSNATSSPSAFDAAFNPVTGELEPVQVFAGYAGFQHWWTDTVRSSVSYSWVDASYDTPQPGYLDLVQSARGNVFWSPVPRVDFGLEGIFGIRKDVNGTEGANFRLHGTAKYNF